MCGRVFYVVPLSLLPDLIPLRIDVILPDQETHPPELRDILQSDFSVAMRHDRLRDLGICQLICRKLDQHCADNLDFLSLYQTLPFGSRIMFENVSANTREMALSISSAHDLERKLLSVNSLRKLWGDEVSSGRWPMVINLDQLRLKRQLHDTVSLVKLKAGSQNHSDEDLILKSSTTDPQFMYHELKFLLIVPSHSNLMKPPLYLVTKKCNFGGKLGVCGFILRYYPHGSLRDTLPMRIHTGSLSVELQIKWCRQLTSALIHIREAAGTFYSDLRPDNVLLSSSTHEGSEDIVLCDFEQRGNWYEWCAPEILYNMYADNLRTCPNPEAQCYLAGHVPEMQIQNGPHGSNSPWFSLSPESQEKAMVYSLGIFFYCIFEGLSNPRNSLANAWPYEPNIAFPEFRRTPPFIKKCIKWCTVDAPEWAFEAERDVSGTEMPRIWRIGGRLFPCRRPSDGAKIEDPEEAVLGTAKIWWANELQSARVFFESEDWRSGRCGSRRPTLREILTFLDEFSAEQGEMVYHIDGPRSENLEKSNTP